MNEEKARVLIETYVMGWKEHDVTKILQPLTQACIVIESHGPTYRGTSVIKEWAEQWINAGNKVRNWNIKNFYLANNKNGAFFEWIFDCFADGHDYHIDGASIVAFKNDKISSIHEYLMSHSAFDWKSKT